jgi:hypothetical protein
MPIPLEDEFKPGLPVVKRTALGQTFHGAVIRVEQRDRLKRDEVSGTMVPVLKAGGKARQELVVTCLTLPGTNAPVGLGDDEHVPEEEDLVRLILKGKAFSDWIQSKAELNRPVQVGDIVTQTTDRAQVYDANGNASGPEITNQAALNAVPRGRSVGIYGPVTLRAAKENSEWVAKAEDAYHALHEPIVAEPASVPAGGDPWGNADDEPPF